MSAGRPSKYNEEVQESADAYLENYASLGDTVPSLLGLADELQVSVRTLHAWGEQHEQFLHTLDAIKSRQGRKLLTGGLQNDMNPTIVKLMLHNHGYSDKQEQEISGPGGGPIETDNTWTVEVHEVKDGQGAD